MKDEKLKKNNGIVKDVVCSLVDALPELIDVLTESGVQFDKIPIEKLIQEDVGWQIPKNRFKATPELINSLSSEKDNDDIMFKLTLLSLIENA